MAMHLLVSKFRNDAMSRACQGMDEGFPRGLVAWGCVGSLANKRRGNPWLLTGQRSADMSNGGVEAQVGPIDK